MMLMMISFKKHRKELYAFHSSHLGASHKKVNQVCQDASGSSYKEKYAIAIVCDGHGGNNYFRSNQGSQIATEVTIKVIKEFMGNFLKPNASKSLREKMFINKDQFMRQLAQSIIVGWQKQIAEDYRNRPFTSEELLLMDEKFRKKYETNPEESYIKAYGTTLIASVVYPGYFWFGLQIGDGKCVAAYEDGTFNQPIPWDDACFLNVTTSLCDGNAIDKFRYCLHENHFPRAIFMGTDGVDDSFANDKDLYDFYQEVLQTFQEKDEKLAKQEIENFLPILSEKGSGDDISVAGIIYNKV
ncbi:MAG: protein phosphatase 2C domain-containing protein [Parabacteroides sp.]|nr:protein phosphatase 2C domain-containing protein [Parabacteroides sp.]